jgi:hypothetical protein
MKHIVNGHLRYWFFNVQKSKINLRLALYTVSGCTCLILDDIRIISLYYSIKNIILLAFLLYCHI